MRSVLVISKSWLERDPRVYKQILFLKEAGLRVCSVGLSPSGIEDAFYPMAINRKGLMVRSLRHTRSAVRLRLRKYDGFYWSEEWKSRILKRLSEDSQHFDLVVANDIPALPLALAISERHGAKLYLDAHEYEPLHYDSFLFNFFFRDYWHWICRKYLPRIDHMTTVSQGIADEYAENFDVRCEVMMNLPFYEGIEPVDRKDGKIRMIHHGVAARRRRMENMIELMDHLDSRFQLDL
ncbi:MAG: glycosyltransferase, partial [Spirochaetales bacterium]|nr:glycosyltransferase [Spirochaetales bacterium]